MTLVPSLFLLYHLLLVHATWPANLYPFTMAEAWLLFIHTNRKAFDQVAFTKLLGTALLGCLDRLALRFAHVSGMTNADLVDNNLHTLNINFKRLEDEYRLELVGLDVLLASLKTPLTAMLNEAWPERSLTEKVSHFLYKLKPKRAWLGCSGSPKIKPRIALPRTGKEFLLLSKTIPMDLWIPVLLHLVRPLMLVLETARKVGCTDYKLVRKVYTEKFDELYPVAVKLTKARPITIITTTTHRRIRQKAPTIEPVKPLRIKAGRVSAKKSGLQRNVAPVKQLGDLPRSIPPVKQLVHLKAATVPAKQPMSPRMSASVEYNAAILSVLESMIQGQSGIYRIPSKISKYLSKDQAGVNEIYNRSNVLITRLGKTHLLPILADEHWMLLVLKMQSERRATLILYNPLSSKNNIAAQIVADSVLHSISAYHEERISNDCSLEWNDPVINSNIEGWVTDKPTETAGLVMEYCRILIKGKDPFRRGTHWQVGALRGAISILSFKDDK
ncbi:hypothetical protein PSACC_03548 [Paramicrosporidium saccamoebae]|uniref:Ubiquitin-like protease family profile domain-containing protein n=1 Tax=Paramicrosporidium saccamoebae TaxID=1246581 RepID=A0A2H9TFJ2_9FUNG|nr:hypothetical protein PSACC_03548 [Paramicrosporidium saccamoebae]